MSLDGCCVPSCKSTRATKYVRLHNFPKSIKLRNEWLQAIKLDTEVGCYSFVCSRHFKRVDFYKTGIGGLKSLKKNAIPSMNIPQPARTSIEVVDKLERNEETKVYSFRTQFDLDEQRSIGESTDDTSSVDNISITSSVSRSSMTNSICPNRKYSTASQGRCQSFVGTQTERRTCRNSLEQTTHEHCTRSVQTQTELIKLNVSPGGSKTTEETGVQASRLAYFKETMYIGQLINTDAQMTAYTGCNCELIDKLVNILDEYKHFKSDCNENDFLSTKDCILLTLMSIKLEINFTILGFFFKHSTSRCKKIFDNTLTDLATVIKKYLNVDISCGGVIDISCFYKCLNEFKGLDYTL